jgi:hypothetical protein
MTTTCAWCASIEVPLADLRPLLVQSTWRDCMLGDLGGADGCARRGPLSVVSVRDGNSWPFLGRATELPTVSRLFGRVGVGCVVRPLGVDPC